MKAVLVMLLCVLVLLQVRLWMGAGSVADIVRLQGAIAEQDEENAGLQARNQVLMDDVSDLRNGLDSIEERARNELGMIRRGETFYLIVEDDPNAGKLESPVPSEAAVSLPAELAPEPPPEIIEEDNEYLEMFRDEAATQAPAGLTAGQ